MTTKVQRSRGMPRRTAVDAPTSRTPLLIGMAVVGIVALLAVLALVLGGVGAGGLSEPATTPIRVSGDTLPALDAGASSDPAVGLPIPTITGTDQSGEPMTIGPDDGPLALVIVAHWCPHCQAEVPRIQDWLDAGGLPTGVKLVSVVTSTSSTRPNYPPSAWLKRENWSPPVLVDDADSTALQAFGMNSFPAFVFVDGNGRVVARTTGEITIDQLQATVDQLAPQ